MIHTTKLLEIYFIANDIHLSLTQSGSQLFFILPFRKECKALTLTNQLQTCKLRDSQLYFSLCFVFFGTNQSQYVRVGIE